MRVMRAVLSFAAGLLLFANTSAYAATLLGVNGQALVNRGSGYGLAANGMENELALTYVAFGRVCARQGKMAAAREYLERAAEIFERLGTLNEPDRVRAALAELPPA